MAKSTAQGINQIIHELVAIGEPSLSAFPVFAMTFFNTLEDIDWEFSRHVGRWDGEVLISRTSLSKPFS